MKEQSPFLTTERRGIPASRQLLNITKAALEHAEAELVTQRNAIIEECVTEIEKFDKRAFEKQVAAIRALKE